MKHHVEEFERELYPGMEGLTLFRESLSGRPRWHRADEAAGVRGADLRASPSGAVRTRHRSPSVPFTRS